MAEIVVAKPSCLLVGRNAQKPSAIPSEGTSSTRTKGPQKQGQFENPNLHLPDPLARGVAKPGGQAVADRLLRILGGPSGNKGPSTM